MASSNPKVPFLGCKISLISRSEIRYEGILYTVDVKESTLALAKVISLGTEDRPTDKPVPPRSEVYEYIIFRAADIKDVRVCEPPKSLGGLDNDPAIVKHSDPKTMQPAPAPVSRVPNDVGAGPFGGFANFNGVPTGPWVTNGSVALFDALGVGPRSPRGRAENRRPRHLNRSKTTDEGHGRAAAAEVHHYYHQPVQKTMRAVVKTPGGDGRRRRANSHRSQTDAVSEERVRRQPTPGPEYIIDVDPQSPNPSRTTQGQGRNQPGRRRRPRSGTRDNDHLSHAQQNGHVEQNGHLDRPEKPQPHQVNSHSQTNDQHHQQQYGGQQGNQRGGGRGRFRGGGGGNRGQNRGRGGRWGWNNWNYRGGWYPRGRGRRQSTRQPAEEPTKFDSDFDFEGAEEEFKKLFISLKAKQVELSPDLMRREEGELPPTPAKKFYEKSKFFDEISCEAQERAQGHPQERKDWRVERKLNSETFGEALANRGNQGMFRGRGGYYNNYYGRRGGFMRRGGGSYRWNRSTGIPVPSVRPRRSSTETADTGCNVTVTLLDPTPERKDKGVSTTTISTATTEALIAKEQDCLGPLPQRGPLSNLEAACGIAVDLTRKVVEIETL